MADHATLQLFFSMKKSPVLYRFPAFESNRVRGGASLFNGQGGVWGSCEFCIVGQACSARNQWSSPRTRALCSAGGRGFVAWKAVMVVR